MTRDRKAKLTATLREKGVVEVLCADREESLRTQSDLLTAINRGPDRTKKATSSRRQLDSGKVRVKVVLVDRVEAARETLERLERERAALESRAQ